MCIRSLLFLISIFVCSFALAQDEEESHNVRQCVSKQEMDELFARVRASRLKRVEEGKLKPLTGRTLALTPHSFIFPLKAAPNYYQPGFYYISNYVDVNSSSSGNNSVQDYNCGTRSYDTPPTSGSPSGYDHSGIDISTGPFGWKMMDDNSVHVVAAEEGEIIEKNDNEFSRTCRTGGQASTYYGNYIVVEHADLSWTMYMHMKAGTLTSKAIGERVSTGEYLGVVASSGNSSGPHLHFEVRDPFGSILDPFQNGNCNDATGVGSLWANEEPYINKRILAVFTLSGIWSNSTCDTTGVSNGSSEVVPFKNHFNPGDPLYVSSSVRDIQMNNTVRLRILNETGTEYLDNTYIYPNAYNDMIRTPVLFTTAPSIPGTYRLLCTYNGQTETHLFSVGCSGAQTLSGARGSNSGVISGSSINSTETISASASNVQYQAETYIQFNPGFHVATGAEFLARIDACTIGGQRTTAEKAKKD